jgi:EAL domain-containing protein (putative c-di-GMP-specific phosphodiesterase class I)
MQLGHHPAGVFDRLCTQGIRLRVDDFGNGYSAFAYLCRFSLDVLSLDVLRIDRRRIDEIADQPDARVTVDTVVAIGQALGRKGLAEGVETQAQLDILREQVCDLFSGYLKSRLVEPNAIAALLLDAHGGVVPPAQHTARSLRAG